MVYLIIPVLSFVVLAGLFWALLSLNNHEKVWKGRINGLDVILSVLMTAKWGEPCLLMKVPKRVTWLKMTFPSSAVRLEMPLITRLQQSRKQSYLAILRDLRLDAQISRNNSDHDTLEFEAEGSPAMVSAIIRDAFIQLFEVDPTRVLEFRVSANWSDLNVIDQALHGRRPGDKVDLPVAATQRYEEGADRKTRVGCMWGLAGLLLLPVPFMIAYLEFGYIAASAVLIAIFVCREVYRRWRRVEGFLVFDILKTILLGLAGATVYLNDSFYLQLIPTIVLSLAAVAELYSVLFDRPTLYDPKGEKLPRPERLLLSFAIVATCVVGVATNEFLRANVTLDVWVWFFAFVRVELFLGFLTSSMPFILYQVRHDLKAEGDSSSS